MDPILTSNVIIDSKADPVTCLNNTFDDSSSIALQSEKENEKRKAIQLSTLEIERTCIRPMNSDDIISKELPYKILDTDFDGKDEDNQTSTSTSELLSLQNNTCCENRINSEQETENHPSQLLTKTDPKIDIEQDTGYSSDTNENVKLVTNKDDSVSHSGKLADDKKCETTELNSNDISQQSSIISAIDNDGNTECTQHYELPNTNTEREISDPDVIFVSESISNASMIQISEEGKNSEACNSDSFIPTIVGIRGACDSETSNPNEVTISRSFEIEPLQSSDAPLQQINIVNVQGGCENLKSGSNKKSIKFDDIQVADGTHNAPTNEIDLTLYSTELDIKQEPPETVDGDDCMYVSTQHVGTCFTSEIFIKEEDALENKDEEEEEVIYIESSGKIPLPIPIKSEANVDTIEKLTPDSNSQLSSKNTEDIFSVSTSLSPKECDQIVEEVFLRAGYTCHLCNTTFQEHELLNEHMILHRNNRLVNSKTVNKMKQKMKPICPVCKRQLSTWQSLQQHVMIHNDEKPYVCSICNKDFRHLSNYKLHLQKHETEKAQSKSYSEKSANKLMSVNQKTRELDTRRVNPSKLSFSTSTFRRDNTKENVNTLHRTYTYKNRAGESVVRNRTTIEDADDDVIPLKTFNNVENIVMNAARFIVKVDNIDPNVLKRRIKTPDISIDKNSMCSRQLGEKRKIVLSPDKNKRLKLDQIENIIMDEDSDTKQVPIINLDDDKDYDYGDDYIDSDCEIMTGETSKERKYTETLTENELYELLNDESGCEYKNKTNDDYVSVLRRNAQMILKSEAEKSKNSLSKGSSNVIMLKCTSPSRRAASPASDTNMYLQSRSKIYETSNVYSNENCDFVADHSDDEMNHDSFDIAFHRVAVRRLLMIQKRAARNNGKIDSKYLMGPLFWRKALRRAKVNPIDFDASIFSDSLPQLKTTSNDVKLDDRLTNDPKHLQIRAENKLSSILDKIRLTNNVDDLNLVGPLFWKRTLKLAGIRYPQDLSTLLGKERVCLRDIEFVTDELCSVQKNDKGSKNGDESNVEENKTNNQGETNVLDFLHYAREAANQVNKTNDNSVLVNLVEQSELKKQDQLVNSILSDVVVQPSVSKNITSQLNEIPTVGEVNKVMQLSNVFTNNKSILYDSLTKPLDTSLKQMENAKEAVSATVNVQENTEISNNTNIIVSNDEKVDLEDEVSTNNLGSSLENDGLLISADPNSERSERLGGGELSEVLDESNARTIAMNAAIDGTNIVLSMGENFQLIASDNEKLAALPEGMNYVLVSDESGAMQLVKENDLRLVEGNDISGAQYVVNVQGENYGNIELMGQANGEQLTYALQFDGENYTAVQFVQNNEAEEKELRSEENISETGVALKSNTETGYILPTVATDLNNIGKELSDFLNLDYGTLMENDDNVKFSK